MERWKHYFYGIVIIEDNIEIRDEVIHHGLNEQIEPQQKMRYGK
jgi:hypothetical protein